MLTASLILLLVAAGFGLMVALQIPKQKPTTKAVAVIHGVLAPPGWSS